MNFLVAATMALFSVLVPAKMWYPPAGPVEIDVQVNEPVQLMVSDFSGKELEAQAPNEIAKQQVVDVKAMFPQIAQPGSYVLFAVPKGKTRDQFIGTPVVIQARTSPRSGGPIQTNVIRVSPLCYMNMETDKGTMKMLFWYDVAPNTVASFLSLAQGGFYDNVIFHRIVPGFVIQGGDPTGTGFGGPGYNVGGEFNDRAHDVGVLSMARTGDPLEGKGIPPRPEFANSAGSQFFICLSREKTEALDRKYTAFGQVFEGLEVMKEIAATPLSDASSGKPKTAPIIKKATVVPVTAKDNPYAEMLKLEATPAAQAQ